MKHFECRNAEAVDCAFRTAGEHNVAASCTDTVKRITDGIGAARACGRHCMSRSVNAERHADVAARFVRNQFRNSHRRTAVLLALRISYTAVFRYFKAADADAHEYACLR